MPLIILATALAAAQPAPARPARAGNRKPRRSTASAPRSGGGWPSLANSTRSPARWAGRSRSDGARDARTSATPSGPALRAVGTRVLAAGRARVLAQVGDAYARQFTLPELRAIVRFLASPAGRALCRRPPPPPPRHRRRDAGRRLAPRRPRRLLPRDRQIVRGRMRRRARPRPWPGRRRGCRHIAGTQSPCRRRSARRGPAAGSFPVRSPG